MPGRPRAVLAVAHLAMSSLEVVVAWMVMVVGIVPCVLGIQQLVAGPDRASGAALLVAGLAVTGLLALATARPLAVRTRRRLLQVSTAGPAGWVDGPALAWLATTLTVRAAVAALGLFAVLLGGIAVVAPVLVSGGERIDVGPWQIADRAPAVVFALVGLGCLVAVVASAPRLVGLDARLARALLVGREERLERDLAEATTSRARIVDAFDVERRRIERDLHDGVQPELLRVSMTLGLALNAMPEDDAARALVAQAQRETLAVLESLRRFVRGIHPQVLDDHGLTAALRELTSASEVRVTVDDRLRGRLPRHVEAALYYATAELLSNVAKHAHATTAQVSAVRDAGHVVVTVTDDGRGGADPCGRGLTGISDRLTAIDAHLDIDSPAGGPTRATITAPVGGAP